MAKPSNREKILCGGLQVVHEHGYAGASVRDIVQAAGVPQGSFTNHFGSKEAFGLEVIDLYYAQSQDLIAATVRNDALPALERLTRFIDSSVAEEDPCAMRNGCLLGNFAAEASNDSEPIRHRLVEVFADMQASIAYCLQAAVDEGSVPADLNVDDTAAFILSSLQGARLLAKTTRNALPLQQFKKNLFEKMLR